jgi:hypothetical protein
MISKPVLIQPDFEKPFFVHTDASSYGAGAILMQEKDNGNGKPCQHPIAYYSSTFTPTERNYDVYERELLAVVKALDHWKAYLKWTTEPFTIVTDHANLLYWKAARKLNRRTARWHAELQDYHFTIQHTPGTKHSAADALSQPPGEDEGKDDNQDIIMLPTEVFVNGTTILDPEEQRNIMQQYHDHPTAGHPRRDKTIRLVTKEYWWPNIRILGLIFDNTYKGVERANRTKTSHTLDEYQSIRYL